MLGHQAAERADFTVRGPLFLRQICLQSAAFLLPKRPRALETLLGFLSEAGVELEFGWPILFTILRILLTVKVNDFISIFIIEVRWLWATARLALED